MYEAHQITDLLHINYLKLQSWKFTIFLQFLHSQEKKGKKIRVLIYEIRVLIYGVTIV